jgi:hypothetical protein
MNSFKGNYFADMDKWDEIQKQGIYEAWVPYVIDKPIDFFVPDPEKDSYGYITSVIDDNTPISEHKILTPMKRRKIVILTSDENCKNRFIPDVTILKIISIKDSVKNQDFYKKYLINDLHPFYVHLPEEITEKESYVNIVQIMTISKKLLIKNVSMMPSTRMDIIESRIADYIDLGNVKETLGELNVSNI